MAEFIIPLTKSILTKLASLGCDIATTYVTTEFTLAKTAKTDLKLIHHNFTAIHAVLQDAEEKQYTNTAMKLWLTDLKTVSYDIDDLLDELSYDASLRAINKGRFRYQAKYYLSTSNPILSRFDLGHKIKTLRDQLDCIVPRKNDFNLTERPVEASRVDRNPLDSCDYVNRLAILGRDEAKVDIIKKLDNNSNNGSTLTVLSIVGMGGIGKTALAKLVSHDITNFDIKLWACVSDDFDVEKILAKIMRNHSDENPSLLSLARLMVKLEQLLKGRKYFLVLDDLWVDNVTKWTDLKNVLDVGKPGSVILITTRNTQVSNITMTTSTVGPYNLNMLPDSVCWSIFQQLAFREGEDEKFPNLCEIGRCIVQKCRGVPLVVKALASLLRSERDEVKWLEIQNTSNLKRIHGEYDDAMKLLKLSYIRLPSDLKAYFVYLALFQKDTEYSVPFYKYVVSALGPPLIISGNSELQSCKDAYCDYLLSRSMIQDSESGFTGTVFSFKVHDLLHDIALDVLGEELAVITETEFINVSESTRHLVWQRLKGSTDDENGLEPLFKAKKARTFRIGRLGNHVSKSLLEKIISSFTCLRILELRKCSIYDLPSSVGNLKHLRYLNLEENPIKSLPDTVCELLHLQTLHLEYCDLLKELPKRLHRMLGLRILNVTTCQTRFTKFPGLLRLNLESCLGLTSLWESNSSVGRLTSLRSLYIVRCPRLTRLPDSMKNLVSLDELWIEDCVMLDLWKGEGLSGLQRLSMLCLIELPMMVSVPYDIQSAALSLQCLMLDTCQSLQGLPIWFDSFGCLRKLLIRGCPYLSRRCAAADGQDYPLLQHVSEFYLDDRIVSTTGNQNIGKASASASASHL